jgi:hypothetical protein
MSFKNNQLGINRDITGFFAPELSFLYTSYPQLISLTQYIVVES